MTLVPLVIIAVVVSVGVGVGLGVGVGVGGGAGAGAGVVDGVGVVPLSLSSSSSLSCFLMSFCDSVFMLSLSEDVVIIGPMGANLQWLFVKRKVHEIGFLDFSKC